MQNVNFKNKASRDQRGDINFCAFEAFKNVFRIFKRRPRLTCQRAKMVILLARTEDGQQYYLEVP